MAKMRRGNYRARLASLEERAERVASEQPRRVVIWLPRKDGDTQPLGVISRSANSLTVLYDIDEPDPPLPEGW